MSLEPLVLTSEDFTSGKDYTWRVLLPERSALQGLQSAGKPMVDEWPMIVCVLDKVMNCGSERRGMK